MSRRLNRLLGNEYIAVIEEEERKGFRWMKQSVVAMTMTMTVMMMIDD